jgi:hypothetical protein
MREFSSKTKRIRVTAITEFIDLYDRVSRRSMADIKELKLACVYSPAVSGQSPAISRRAHPLAPPTTPSRLAIIEQFFGDPLSHLLHGFHFIVREFTHF